MSDIISIAVEAAEQAGKILLDNFGKINSIVAKGDRDFATNLDREAEKIIVDKIKTRFPGHGIIAEEGGKQNATADYLWIIDPLDGTHNYMHSIPIFGVSIGIVYKSEFFAGVIFMPVDKELYVAEKGKGAVKNGKKISVSTRRNIKECSLSFDSSLRFAPEKMLPALDHLAQEVFNIRMFGSSARALSYIAEGKLDAAVEFHDQPWDFAGGVSLIQEAGGKVTSLSGKALRYDDVGYIASNAIYHEALQNIIFR